jgi:hypothetical protein
MRNPFCNMCGKKFDICDEQEDFSIYRRRIGYGSKYDGHELKLDLCCECMDRIIGDCMINPVAHDWEA